MPFASEIELGIFLPSPIVYFQNLFFELKSSQIKYDSC